MLNGGLVMDAQRRVVMDAHTGVWDALGWDLPIKA